MNVAGLEPRPIGFDEKSAHAVGSAFAGALQLCPHHGYIGNRSRGDPHLLAVQDVFIAGPASASRSTRSNPVSRPWPRPEATCSFVPPSRRSGWDTSPAPIAR